MDPNGLFLMLASALAQVGEAPAETPPRVELPPGPVAEAWSKVAADQAPARVSAEWPPFAPAPGDSALAGGPGGWSTEDPWNRWAELVRAEGAAERPAPERRASLALVAALQSRADDAWAHFAACAAEPASLAALLPHLLPGIPPDVDAGAGGLPLPLPDGAVLRPILPPEPASAPGAMPPRCAAIVRGFRVGQAELALELSFESDGVQIDLFHLGGGPASVSVVLPCPPQYRFEAQYANWEESEVPLGGAHVLQLEPGGQRQTLWGRFGTRGAEWPETLPRQLPAAARETGIELWPAGPPDARVDQLARALAAVLEIPVRVRGDAAAMEAERAEGMAPLRVAVPGGVERERALAFLIGRAERFALVPR